MKRPNTILVFGILHIVFGLMGCCGFVFQVGLFGMPDDGTNPVIQLVHESPGYRAFIIASIALGLLASGLLVTAGIGLLNDRAWARPLSNGYAIYAIVLTLVTAAVNAVFLLGPAIRQTGGPMTPEQTGALVGAIGGTCGSLFGLIYPVCVLIFLNRPAVRQWLESPGSAVTGDAVPMIDPWDR